MGRLDGWYRRAVARILLTLLETVGHGAVHAHPLVDVVARTEGQVRLEDRGEEGVQEPVRDGILAVVESSPEGERLCRLICAAEGDNAGRSN